MFVVHDSHDTLQGFTSICCGCSHLYPENISVKLTCVCIPEILCPPLNVPNATREGGSYKFGAIVTYGCNEKMRFKDGMTSKNISCVGSGEWNETDLSCAGKTLFSLVLLWSCVV